MSPGPAVGPAVGPATGPPTMMPPASEPFDESGASDDSGASEGSWPAEDWGPSLGVAVAAGGLVGAFDDALDGLGVGSDGWVRLGVGLGPGVGLLARTISVV